MSEHKASIAWRRESTGFDYSSYNRNHVVGFESGAALAASSAPEFLGDAKKVNPEELLAGSLASCHMLTFLAIASKKGFVVDSYNDAPIAVLEKGEDGKLWVTQIRLKPKILFSGDKQPDQAQIQSMHESAHRNCFIGSSIKSKVVIEPDSNS